MNSIKLSLYIFTLFYSYIIVFPEDLAETFNVKVKPKLVVGNKKNIQFILQEEINECVTEKFNEKNKLKNIIDFSKFECNLLVEVLEINEEEKLSKIQVTFNKATYLKDGEAKNMHFALNEPYILVTKAYLTKCYLKGNEINIPIVLNFLRMMEIDISANERIVISNFKIGEIKNSAEELLNISQVDSSPTIEKVKSTVQLKEISYNEEFKEMCSKVFFENLYKIENDDVSNKIVSTIKIEKEIIIGQESNNKFQSKLVILRKKEFQGLNPEDYNLVEIIGISSSKVTTTIKVMGVEK